MGLLNWPTERWSELRARRRPRVFQAIAFLFSFLVGKLTNFVFLLPPPHPLGPESASGLDNVNHAEPGLLPERHIAGLMHSDVGLSFVLGSEGTEPCAEPQVPHGRVGLSTDVQTRSTGLRLS